MIRKLVIMLLSGAICLLGATSALAAKYNEAPMLKVKVAAGELPAVEERLPKEPLIVPVVKEIGQYGGTLYGIGVGSLGVHDSRQVLGIERILWIGKDLKSIEPNIANWKFSKDGKSLTLYLKKGIKWSDGVPFTADDVMFWYEDILLNDELMPAKPKAWCPGGELMKIKKIDDYTIRLDFAVPYPVILLYLAHSYGSGCWKPKHYLKQFHPRYTPMENLQKLIAEEEGIDFWYQLFQAKDRYAFSIPMDVGVPTLGPYMCEKRKLDGIDFVRNPYYWKVDAEGNQLPYIDRIKVTETPTPELVNAKILSGEVDLTWGFLTSLSNLALYKQGEKEGNYQVHLWQSTDSSAIFYQPNQTIEKPVLRKIFRDVRFRRALSLGINREEINNVVFFGLGTPCQMTIRPESSYYEPEFAEAYAKYDPEEANRLLNEMGLSWDEKHKYRLGPDGKPISWTIEFFVETEYWTKVTELVKEYWENIGLQMNLKRISGELLSKRCMGNEIEMGMWHADKQSDILFPIDPEFYIPWREAWECFWGPLWARWYQTNGKKGEEPPEKIARLYKLWETVKTTMDEKERIQAGKEILRSQAENIWVIGTVMIPKPVIVANDLQNVPETGVCGWDYLGASYCHPEQLFFKPGRGSK